MDEHDADELLDEAADDDEDELNNSDFFIKIAAAGGTKEAEHRNMRTKVRIPGGPYSPPPPDNQSSLVWFFFAYCVARAAPRDDITFFA